MTRHAMRLATAMVAFACLMLAQTAQVRADDVAQAREHYDKGKALFAEGDYQSAIYEFEAAERLAPSPINDFNIGLAYDEMGNQVSALRHYESYLERMPDAANAAAVKAKIRRIESELKAEADAAEARRKDEEPAPADAGGPSPGDDGGPSPGDDGGPSPGDASDAGEPGGAVAPVPGTTADPGAGEPADAIDSLGPDDAADDTAAPAAGTTSRQPPPQPQPQPRPASTGDPELDRVAAVDVGAIRDQRQQALGGDSQASVGGQGSSSGQGGAGGAPAPAEPAPTDQPDDEGGDPVYKKWWFWVVVGVSAVILIDIATTDAGSEPTRAGGFSAPSGVTVFSF